MSKYFKTIYPAAAAAAAVAARECNAIGHLLFRKEIAYALKIPIIRTALIG